MCKILLNVYLLAMSYEKPHTKQNHHQQITLMLISHHCTYPLIMQKQWEENSISYQYFHLCIPSPRIYFLGECFLN